MSCAVSGSVTFASGRGTAILVMKHRTGGSATGTLVLGTAGNDYQDLAAWLVGSNAVATITNYHQVNASTLGGSLPLDVALISQLTGSAQTMLTGLGASASTATSSGLNPTTFNLFARVLSGVASATSGQDISIAECAIVNRELAAGESDAVFDYLASKYPSLVS